MCKTLLILAFVAMLATALAVNCPEADGTGTPTYYPHETECTLFYECTNGVAKLLECPNGLYWDSNLNVCNWNVDCGDLHK